MRVEATSLSGEIGRWLDFHDEHSAFPPRRDFYVAVGAQTTSMAIAKFRLPFFGGKSDDIEASLPPDPEATAGEVLLDVEPGVKMKTEVVITNLVPELTAVFQIIFEAYKKYGYADSENPIVITSGNDSDEHVANSYHYKDRAIDIRGKHVPDATLAKIAKHIQGKLGPGFHAWAELFERKRWYKDHIHIEYRGETARSP